MFSTLRVRTHDGDKRPWWEITESLLSINADDVVATNIHVVDGEGEEKEFDIVLGASINPVIALAMIRGLGFEPVVED